MNLYSDLIVDLYKHPLNKRPIPSAHITNSGANVTCGDRFRLYATVNKKNELIDVSFEGEGCAISIAGASLLTQEAKGHKLEEVAQWNTLNVFEWLGAELGPSRVKCGVLALETLQEGIKKKLLLDS